VQFQRLRLSGFKSFVDATELRIEPGITGIVGPNGCGKSNLLEALRWVMGANSAKAMRAGGMDDVIFAGSGGRTSRNHAEVVLTIDNAERRAPAAYNDSPILEVVRRIDRGEGSTYRINGREVRARDVQLLFADASTGSNSPALVRQGQISELIAAKPQNRRMILEEAAGVSGLHSRRHEAELRLRAAETNLARLGDIARELDSALNRLRREARNAERYRRLSGEIRTLQAAVLHARWAEAGEAVRRLTEEAEEAARGVEDTARAAAGASARSARAEAAMVPLREAETVAAAILNKLAIDRDRLEREAEALADEVRRLTAEIARIDADRARETQSAADADAALARLAAEIARLEGEIAAAPSRASVRPLGAPRPRRPAPLLTPWRRLKRNCPPPARPWRPPRLGGPLLQRPRAKPRTTPGKSAPGSTLRRPRPGVLPGCSRTEARTATRRRSTASPPSVASRPPSPPPSATTSTQPWTRGPRSSGTAPPLPRPLCRRAPSPWRTGSRRRAPSPPASPLWAWSTGARGIAWPPASRPGSAWSPGKATSGAGTASSRERTPPGPQPCAWRSADGWRSLRPCWPVFVPRLKLRAQPWPPRPPPFRTPTLRSGSPVAVLQRPSRPWPRPGRRGSVTTGRPPGAKPRSSPWTT